MSTKISYGRADKQNEKQLPAAVLLHENIGDIFDKNKPYHR
jgi:hypothetical protein